MPTGTAKSNRLIGDESIVARIWPMKVNFCFFLLLDFEVSTRSTSAPSDPSCFSCFLNFEKSRCRIPLFSSELGGAVISEVSTCFSATVASESVLLLTPLGCCGTTLSTSCDLLPSLDDGGKVFG